MGDTYKRKPKDVCAMRYDGYNAFRLAEWAEKRGMARHAFEREWGNIRPEFGDMIVLDVSEPVIKAVSAHDFAKEYVEAAEKGVE